MSGIRLAQGFETKIRDTCLSAIKNGFCLILFVFSVLVQATEPLAEPVVDPDCLLDLGDEELNTLFASQAVRQQALASLAEIEAARSQLNRAQNTNGNVLTTRRLEIEVRLWQLQDYLTRDQVHLAILLYASVFEKVEVAAHVIKRNREAIALINLRLEDGTITDEIADPQLASLQLELDRRLLDFGSNYNEYLLARRVLEAAIAQDRLIDINNINSPDGVLETMVAAPAVPIPQPRSLSQIAREVLAGIGVGALRQMYPDLEIPARRLGIRAIERLAQTIPEILLNRILTSAARERRGVFIRFTHHLEKALLAVLHAMSRADRNWISAQGVESLAAFFGVSEPRYLYDTYMLPIARIMREHSNTTARLEALRRVGGINQVDELLLTFVRTVEFTQEWYYLKMRARLLGTVFPQYQWYYDRMVAAETRAEDMDPLSLTNRPSPATRIGLYMTTGVAATPVVYHLLTNAIPDIVNAIRSAFGGG